MRDNTTRGGTMSAATSSSSTEVMVGGTKKQRAANKKVSNTRLVEKQEEEEENVGGGGEQRGGEEKSTTRRKRDGKQEQVTATTAEMTKKQKVVNNKRPHMKTTLRIEPNTTTTTNATTSTSIETLKHELDTMHKKLATMTQGNPSEAAELNRITSSLASSTVLDNPERSIRANAARCLVDVLFLHAPDAPFEDATLKRVFYLLIESLQGLEQTDPTHPAFECARYVLARMAPCKLSCVLGDLPDMPGDGGHRTEDMALEMFETILTSVAPSHGIDLEKDAVEVLSAYFEQVDEVPPLLLDSVLCRLLPERRKESHRAFDVARAVVGKTADRLRPSITSVVNGILTSQFTNRGDRDDMVETELADHVGELVLALHRIDPNLLLTILPNVENALMVDDLDARRDAVKLLSDIFLESSDVVVTDNDRLLLALLGRVVDKSFEIRLLLVKFVGWALSKPEVSRVLRDVMLTRRDMSWDIKRTVLEVALADPETSIRAEAIELAAHYLNLDTADMSLAETVAKAVGERLSDVDTDIALRAGDGLAWAFAKHCLPLFISSNRNEHHQWSESPQYRALGWVPTLLMSTLVSTIRNEEDMMRLVTSRVGLMDSAILPPSSSSRLEVLLCIWGDIEQDDKAKSAFVRFMIEERAEAQTMLRHALSCRKQDEAKSLEEFTKMVVRFIPKTEGGDETTATTIWSLRDGAIFDRLSIVSNPAGSTLSTVIDVRRDLNERVGAGIKSLKIKSDAAKKLIKAVVKRVGMLTLTMEEMEQLDVVVSRAPTFTLAFFKAFPVCMNETALVELLGSRKPSIFRTAAALVAMVRMTNKLAIDPLVRVASSSTSEYGDAKLAIKALCSNDTLTAGVSQVFSKYKGKTNWDAKSMAILIICCKRIPALVQPKQLVNDAITFACKTAKAAYVKDETEDDEDEIFLKTRCLKLVGAECLRRIRQQVREDETTLPSKQLVLLLRRFVADGGDPWGCEAARKRNDGAGDGWPMSELPRHRALRVVAASMLCKMDIPEAKSILKEGGSDMENVIRSTQRLIQRARLASDPDQETREKFAGKLVKHELEKGRHMIRDGAMLAIVAAQHQGGTSSNTYLGTLKQLVQALADKAEEAKKSATANAAMTVPELLLPNLVYLLTYHPLMPRDLDSARIFAASVPGQKALCRPIILLCDALQSAHGKGARADASMSFMLASLSAMRAKRDGQNPDSVLVHLMGDLARVVIQKHVKYSPEGLMPYSGPLPLPAIFMDTMMDNNNSSSLDATPHHRTVNATMKMLMASPVSYLPSDFELTGGLHDGSGNSGGGQAGKKKRTSLNMSQVSTTSSKRARKSKSVGGRKSLSKSTTATSSSAMSNRPRRASKVTSYVEASDNDDDDDDDGDSNDA